MTVHDVRGHRVAELASGTFSAGPHVLTWTGVDDQGVPVSSGVYLVRLHGPGIEAVQTVTLVK
jgi:flagellar hook assembly protein FlgD